MDSRFAKDSIQPCANCKEDIGFMVWGNGPRGWWRHIEQGKFYCDPLAYTEDASKNEAMPVQPDCDCDKATNEFCVHCGTAEQLASAGIVGFNSPPEAFGSIEERMAEASAADILFEMELERFGEYNE